MSNTLDKLYLYPLSRLCCTHTLFSIGYHFHCSRENVCPRVYANERHPVSFKERKPKDNEPT